MSSYKGNNAPSSSWNEYKAVMAKKQRTLEEFAQQTLETYKKDGGD
jgi:hypothetical protein